jgi:hypothetical protein
MKTKRMLDRKLCPKCGAKLTGEERLLVSTNVADECARCTSRSFPKSRRLRGQAIRRHMNSRYRRLRHRLRLGLGRCVGTPVMMPRHPRWDEFIKRLNGPEGCNFRRETIGAKWNCDASTRRPHARRILKRMGFDDLEILASLAYFSMHGGFCDCEILFNVEGPRHRPIRRRVQPAAGPSPGSVGKLGPSDPRGRE